MKIIGLTGSIATGKSFVAAEFRKQGVEVFSSDLEVSNILKENEVIAEIRKNKELSNSIIEEKLNKNILSKIVFGNKTSLKHLEEIIHPIVEQKMIDFLKKNSNKKVVLLEIPLLFEKKREKLCNKVISTFCSNKTQRERALRRNNIDNERLDFIIRQQISSKNKAAMTDYLVYTEVSYEFTKTQLNQIFIKEEISA